MESNGDCAFGSTPPPRIVGRSDSALNPARGTCGLFGRTTGPENTALPQFIREMSTSDFYPAGLHHHGWKLMRYLFAAVIAVFVVALDFESSDVRSVWTEPSFVVAEAQSEPATAPNSHILVSHDGLLPPSLVELRRTSRFARNDDPETDRKSGV